MASLESQPDVPSEAIGEEPSTVSSQRFRPHERVRDPRHFRRAFALRRPVSDPVIVLHVAPSGFPYSRLGISVPRKLVRKAVRRNRVKRRLREAFRLSKSDLPVGLDLIVVPRVAELSVLQARSSLIALARDAARRLGPDGDSATAAK